VQAGGDRQKLHERIRVHALAASDRLKSGPGDNDLIERIRNDPAIPRIDLGEVLDPARYVGRSARQVDEFLASEIEPIRRRYPDRPVADADFAVNV
jgi:adenylosuccinate lyase